MIQIGRQGNVILLPVKVVPKSSRDRIVGELDGALKINVAAAPERGAANVAVCKLLAKELNLRTSQVTVETGHGSPRKIVRISGTSLDVVLERLPIGKT
ncbi:MAG: DUF167 domain-containing protein [Phycisphaerae bacterium]